MYVCTKVVQPNKSHELSIKFYTNIVALYQTIGLSDLIAIMCGWLGAR